MMLSYCGNSAIIKVVLEKIINFDGMSIDATRSKSLVNINDTTKFVVTIDNFPQSLGSNFTRGNKPQTNKCSG